MKLVSAHVLQRDPRPLSTAVLMSAARRLRIPGAHFTDCPGAVMVIGRLFATNKVLKPTAGERCRAFWSRMVQRFTVAEIAEAHAYLSRDYADQADDNGACIQCREFECNCE